MSGEAKKQGEMRKRALGGVIVLGAVGAVLYFEDKSWFYAPWILAAYLLCGFLFLPGLLKPVDRLVWGLSYGIMWIVSRGGLVLLYYFVITPLGLWFRLTGRDRLGKRKIGDPRSFWKKRPPDQRRPGCEKQY